MDKEDVTLFCSITGCDETSAVTYLQMADSDVNSAIQLYYENGETKSPINDSSVNPSRSTEDDIRAPLPRITEQIMQVAPIPQSGLSRTKRFGAWFDKPSDTTHRNGSASTSHQGNDDVIFIGEEASSSTSNLRSSQYPNGSFHTATSSSSSSHHNGNEPRRPLNSGLSNLFEPPADLLFQGSLEDAAKEAHESSRWLLVSLHFDNTFGCHRVNRDVWKNRLVQDIVQSHFVLWQGDSRDTDALNYMRFHEHEPSEPNIAIHHPISTALMERKSRLIAPDDVINFLSNFLSERGAFSERSFIRVSPNNRPRKRTRNQGIDLDSPNVIDVIDLDSDSPVGKSARIDTSSSYSNGAVPCVQSNSPTSKKEDVQKQERPALLPDVDLNPYFSLPSCRLKIRLPDGSAVIRRVSLSQPLEVLLQHLDSNGYSRDAYELVQSYPSRSLRDQETSQTFSSLNFSSSDTLYLQAI